MEIRFNLTDPENEKDLQNYKSFRKHIFLSSEKKSIWEQYADEAAVCLPGDDGNALVVQVYIISTDQGAYCAPVSKEALKVFGISAFQLANDARKGSVPFPRKRPSAEMLTVKSNLFVL